MKTINFDISTLNTDTISLLKNVYNQRYKNISSNSYIDELKLVSDCILINNTAMQNNNINDDLSLLYAECRINNNYIELFEKLTFI